MRDRTRLFTYLTSVVCLLASELAFAQIQGQKIGVVNFDQVGSGLRIVAQASTPDNIFSEVEVANVTKLTIIGFQVGWTVGSDERRNPEIKFDPVLTKGQTFQDVFLLPGKRAWFRLNGPKGSDVSSFLYRRGVVEGKAGIVRIGIIKVIYSDGREQNFDLLKDPQSRRSDEPPDTGGMPPSTVRNRNPVRPLPGEGQPGPSFPFRNVETRVRPGDCNLCKMVATSPTAT